ncbi:MAG: HDIG domain-containing metalloprotein [Endomicrobiia bacterium]
MIKKFFSLIVKTKPVIIKLLSRIEQLENHYIKKTKVNIEKNKFHLPEWLLVVLFSVIFILVYIATYPFIIVAPVFYTIIKVLSILVLIFLIWFSIKHFILKLKIPYLTNLEEYKRRIVIFWLIVILNFTSAYLLKVIDFFSFYFIPVYGFVLLVTLLIDEFWGGVYVILMSSVVAWLFGGQYEIFLFYFISSLYISHLAQKIFSRKDITTVIFKSTLMNIFIGLSLFFVLRYNIELSVFNINEHILTTGAMLLRILTDNLFGGLFAWILIMIFLNPIETIYNRTTNIKLVELANFNHPLLKQLVTETPGTYHHSIIVSSLAEQTATELHANSLLCKVAAYYHDIGKLTKPEYFIENQISSINPHTELNPSLSGLIIINHVKEGVLLAKKYKLDKVIIDIIQQHHGDSLIHGFYEKTLRLGIEGLGENMRYPGPKPQTKEAVIVMIADSCEAACRSITEPDVPKIKETVERVINAKFVEGQFDDSPVTLRDLYKMANIMTHMLTSFYHLRTYQSNEK